MLPSFNERGDLPPGVHPVSWQELAERFGSGTEARRRALAKLKHLHELASRTGKLARFLVFGSFASTSPAPRDVDLALVMAADFKLEHAPRECQTLFAHADADARFGASVFWVREGMLPEALWRDFVDVWQTRRDGHKRGMIEIKP
jgi:hypothetical protein